ncbi:uncharacterized protein LOC126899676 isoform X4 [Daktulosphaira vitifoliae]|uniref:uncharacterized protein LOC126899676 isoform X2 n=1 Tax=Daktulosphaira vitifoliae TaxID=58002 RepID=UPI0021AA27D7|nr:uncharacterized protein LOC126899676 isoform X2 [Daktulosphaira vitifoliae]XP_050530721.1 uncharacterized protein LOC126899676 isoform X3 [Daktulosphaira vitifoliae]XP_050530722.1 uncharacterized protein LOC126899676 isoform X4 [Daktulosphaira vitifoliae]
MLGMKGTQAQALHSLETLYFKSLMRIFSTYTVIKTNTNINRNNYPAVMKLIQIFLLAIAFITVLCNINEKFDTVAQQELKKCLNYFKANHLIMDDGGNFSENFQKELSFWAFIASHYSEYPQSLRLYIKNKMIELICQSSKDMKIETKYFIDTCYNIIEECSYTYSYFLLKSYYNISSKKKKIDFKLYYGKDTDTLINVLDFEEMRKQYMKNRMNK